MSNVIQAKSALRGLATQAKSIVDDATLSTAEKSAKLDALDAERKSHEEVIKRHTDASRLMAGAESFNGGGLASGHASTIAAKGAAVPSLTIPTDALTDGYLSVKGGGGARFELGLKDAASSTATDGQLPPQLVGVVERPFEPTRLASIIPTTAMAGPSVEFITMNAPSTDAAPVAPGGSIPETNLPTTQTVITARKLGILTTITDELLADFGSFHGYVQNELSRQIIDKENDQILNGDGTGQNLAGLLHTSGTLTHAKGTDSNLDAIEQAIAQLRTGAAYCEADGIILNPSDWSLIRRTKDSYGRYLLGDPGQTAVNEIWGVPVYTTTKLAAGTGILGNFEQACTLFVRQGVTLEMSNGQDFTTGQVKIRATERLALGVQRPAALNIITGIA